MSKSRIKNLQALVAKLQVERQAHVDAIAEIDAAFGQLGLPAPDRRGRRAGGFKKKRVAKRKKKRVVRKKTSKKAKKRPAGKTGTRYGVPGPESILRFVTAAGKKGRTGSAIDKHWKKEGRAGTAYKILGQLVAARKIKRQKVKGGRGSVYSAA